MAEKKQGVLAKMSANLIQIAKKDEIADLGAVIGDTALDAAISSGSFDGVPLIGGLIGIYRAGASVKEVIFVQKCERFLGEFAHTGAEDRLKFFDDLEAKGQMEDFGRTLIMLLDKADDLDKPEIIGRIMAAAAAGSIPLPDATRLCKIVDRAFTEDLYELPNLQDGIVHYDSTIADALFSAGLLESKGVQGSGYGPELGNVGPGGTIYAKNRYAHLLINFGLPEHMRPKLSPLFQ